MIADFGYKSLRGAFGGSGSGGGGGGGRKKDAGGYGHGGGVRSRDNNAQVYGQGGYGQGQPPSTGPPIDPYSNQTPVPSAYGSAYSSSAASDPYSSAPYAGQVPMATPPRRGHAMNESQDVSSSPYGNSSPYSRGGAVAGMGYGGDKHLDGLLRAAGGRKKGD